MPVDDFNLGGGGSPSSPSDIYPLIGKYLDSLDRSAERIGANIRASMLQNESQQQAKGLAQAVQSIDPSQQGAIQKLVGVAARFPLGAQTQSGQMAIQMLGSAAIQAQPIAPNPVTGTGGPQSPPASGAPSDTLDMNDNPGAGGANQPAQPNAQQPPASPVDILNSRYQQIQSSAQQLRSQIASMGPVTARNRPVIDGLLRQAAATQTQSDQLAEHIASIQEQQAKNAASGDKRDTSTQARIIVDQMNSVQKELDAKNRRLSVLDANIQAKEAGTTKADLSGDEQYNKWLDEKKSLEDDVGKVQAKVDKFQTQLAALQSGPTVQTDGTPDLKALAQKALNDPNATPAEKAAAQKLLGQ
jgi:hypothetical protein